MRDIMLCSELVPLSKFAVPCILSYPLNKSCISETSPFKNSHLIEATSKHFVSHAMGDRLISRSNQILKHTAYQMN